MNATATEIYDIFSGEWTREKAEQALGVFRKLAKGGVKAEVLERIEDRVEVQVEKSVLQNSKDLATKGDLHALKEGIEGKVAELNVRMDKLDSRSQARFYWIMGGIITVLASIVAGVMGIFQKLP